MNSKKSLRKNRFYIFFVICLIIIGLIIFRHKNNQVVFVSLKTPIPNATYAKVTRVFYGDTIQISTGEKIRYIGVDTSEVYPKEQCYSQEARKRNEELVMGKEVKLVKDISETDKYGRLLRYVYLEDVSDSSHPGVPQSGTIGSILINDFLVKTGYAKVETVPPDVKFANQFLESQKYAKDNKLGLWGKCLSMIK